MSKVERMSCVSASAGAVEAMAESLLVRRCVVRFVSSASHLFEIPEIWEMIDVELGAVKTWLN